MKKLLALALSCALACAALTGCGQDATQAQEDKMEVIKVGASPTPHAEILTSVKDQLAEEGYDLQIMEFTDYIQPNTALSDGNLDANYFQHITYLQNFDAANNATLVSAAGIHYEPFGIYPGKTTALEEIQDGAEIAVPNDDTNETRALLLLQQEGLIKLKDGVGPTDSVTAVDVAENPRGFKIREIAAEQLARSLVDVDLAVINGNYAIQAGFDASTDALALESKSSASTEAYVNVLAVRETDKDSAKIKALVAALTSEDTRKFIEDTYKGAVVPIF